MIKTININNEKGQRISELDITKDGNGNYLRKSDLNVQNVYYENGTLDIDILSTINQDILDEIMDIRFEFGRLSGKWEENEFIFEDIAEEEFRYITSKCKQHGFKYTIKGSVIRDTVEEFEEETLSVEDIENIRCTISNYRQFDALASDIEGQLITYLTSELI